MQSFSIGAAGRFFLFKEEEDVFFVFLIHFLLFLNPVAAWKMSFVMKEDLREVRAQVNFGAFLLA